MIRDKPFPNKWTYHHKISGKYFTHPSVIGDNSWLIRSWLIPNLRWSAHLGPNWWLFTVTYVTRQTSKKKKKILEIARDWCFAAQFKFFFHKGNPFHGPFLRGLHSTPWGLCTTRWNPFTEGFTCNSCWFHGTLWNPLFRGVCTQPFGACMQPPCKRFF